MKADDCTEMRLLIQADVDGELAPADAAAVGAHLEHCSTCATLQAELVSLSRRMRLVVPYYRAPDEMQSAVRARLAAMAAPPGQGPSGANDNRVSWRHRLSRPRLGQVVPFGGGFALAACLALVFLLPSAGDLPDAVVSDHIRALQPGHLMDVVSTDQHTVKPWFDGRLNFAPPVKDLKEEGFPLAGGRLDYLGGKSVAALIYQRRQHVIDLYVWPEGGLLDHGPTEGSRSGYNFLRWSQDGMTFWVVSDLGAAELADFVRLWRTDKAVQPSQQ
jgi:anti-sigma factor RsiW